MGPEAEVVGSGSARPVVMSTPDNKPHGKSPLAEIPFNYANFIFSTSSTPLKPTPTPSISIPFGTISNPKQKQPIIYETTTTSAPITSETTVTEPPQIPPTLLSQIINPTKNTTFEQPPTITNEQPYEPTQPQTTKTFPTDSQLSQLKKPSETIHSIDTHYS
ncbi:uncharacterized protein LOC127095456 [Lathyrus oleraceus]|uniref:uncharacterized protein LOC127095456 n=1 Tax=Pisum sativum TaxID=3888 RepID=UPI0021D2B91B|nr:uncharacterized protein LOC127095456 [Pisum sativum]